eukprot:TRINITY_DN41629_c0_g1_i1.p1 TRINITY_DN41629_c0_g1~~TRINITY_DN41629_c0_g1_i1.p1  ORF type:complete len:219 (+),score=24.47 TRINITY_DN41629_c0_g1_i1:85-741(+)
MPPARARPQSAPLTGRAPPVAAASRLAGLRSREAEDVPRSSRPGPAPYTTYQFEFRDMFKERVPARPLPPAPFGLELQWLYAELQGLTKEERRQRLARMPDSTVLALGGYANVERAVARATTRQENERAQRKVPPTPREAAPTSGESEPFDSRPDCRLRSTSAPTPHARGDHPFNTTTSRDTQRRVLEKTPEMLHLYSSLGCARRTYLRSFQRTVRPL